ncbi:unnamed protein product [Dibothriocephalus latus]|uniref:Uncharacterized protein n=1 Tax=Dibothriocephalus latus TaxID=60516 RepID=A0A3P7LZ45_DIBLA|nr:unnamed protein product [Dibothriocephalus latus]
MTDGKSANATAAVESVLNQTEATEETKNIIRHHVHVHAAAVCRNDANSQLAAHSTRPDHISSFDDAELPVRGDNLMSRELFKFCKDSHA